MIAALLPLLEALAVRGGTASAIGATAGGEAGMAGLMRGIFSSGVQAFGSSNELGAAIQKISNLEQIVSGARSAIEDRNRRREEITELSREQERLYMAADPAHVHQLAELQREQQISSSLIANSQREMNMLRARAEMTTNPDAARAQAFRRTGGTLGAIGLGATFLPQLVRNSAPVQAAGNFGGAAQNVAAFLAGPTNTAVGGQMAGYAGGLANVLGPMHVAGNLMRPGGAVRQVSEVAFELSKLPRLLVNWSAALVDSQRPLAQFSGTLAMAFGRAEQREILRNMASAGRTGGTTSELSNSLQDLHDILQPIRDTVTNVLNRALTAGVDLVKRGVELLDLIWKGMIELDKPVTGLLDALNEQSKIDAKWAERNARAPFVEFADSCLKREALGPKRVPPRPPGGRP